METVTLSVTNREDVGQARRLVSSLSEELGFAEDQRDQLALIATELATNLVVHDAIEGELLLCPMQWGNPGLELISRDRGPGIRDLHQAQRDGHSTGGGMGVGLGTIKRLADEFDIYSNLDPTRSTWDVRSQPVTQPGTVVVARKWLRPPAPDQSHIFAFSRATPGETHNGDGFWITETPVGLRMVICDGLGHGYAAHVATQRAIDYVSRHAKDDLEGLLFGLQPEMRGTRGCAINLLEINFAARTLRYITVGNIAMRLLSPEGSSIFPPQPGVLGMRLNNVPKVRTAPLHNGARLFVFTDGLSRRWNLSAEEPLWNHDSSLLAALLMRDHQRENDDATLVLLSLPTQGAT